MLGKVNSALKVDELPYSGEERYVPKVEKVQQATADMPAIPYNFKSGASLVYMGELHIFGGIGNRTAHHKYNMQEGAWESVSTLNYSFQNGCAVLHKGDMYILGGNFSDDTAVRMSKFNAETSTWETVTSILPYAFQEGAAISYRGDIHLIGGSRGDTRKNHYRWNGTDWVVVGALPYEVYQCGNAIVFDGKIHIFGGTGTQKMHLVYDGSKWETFDNELPVAHYNHSVVVSGGKIHLLGGTNNIITHYINDGETWAKVEDLPYYFINGCANDIGGVLYILGTTYNDENSKKFVKIASEPERLVFNMKKGDKIHTKADVIEVDDIKIETEFVDAFDYISLPSVEGTYDNYYYTHASNTSRIVCFWWQNYRNYYSESKDGNNWSEPVLVVDSDGNQIGQKTKNAMFTHGGKIFVIDGYESSAFRLNESKKVWEKYEYNFGAEPNTLVSYKSVLFYVGLKLENRRFGKWNLSTYTELPSLPFDAPYFSNIVFKNRIYSFSGMHAPENNYPIYSSDGTTWIKEGNAPMNYRDHMPIVIDDVLEFYGNAIYASGQERKYKRYKYDGATWTLIGELDAKIVEVNNSFIFKKKGYISDVSSGLWHLIRVKNYKTKRDPVTMIANGKAKIERHKSLTIESNNGKMRYVNAENEVYALAGQKLNGEEITESGWKPVQIPALIE